jgi:hypothetical protein
MQRLALRQLHIQEEPPQMAIIRTTNGSQLACFHDSDLVIDATMLPEVWHLRLHSPNKQPQLVAAGSADELRALLDLMRPQLVDAADRDVVDAGALLAQVSA